MATHDGDAAKALTPDCDPADSETAQAHATLAQAQATAALAAAVRDVALRAGGRGC